MPVTVRLSEDAEATLDEWVESGKFENKSEAIRAALNTLDWVQTAEDRGEHVVSLSDEDIEKLRKNAGLILARER